MNILIRNTSAGRRAEKVSDEEIKRLLSHGAAVVLRERIYEFVEAPVKAVEPAVVEDIEDTVEDPAEYAHKDMTPKRRGRPPKVRE